MKILIVTQYFWPESFRINDIVNSLMENGHTVDVLTGQPNYPDGKVFEGYSASGFKREVWSGANVYRIPIVPRGDKSAFKLAVNYVSFVASGLIFSPWLLRRKKYDVIFVYGLSPILKTIPAILLSKIKKAPLVTWVQDLWPESLEATGYVKSKKISGFVGWFVQWIYNHSNLILVQSLAFIGPVSSMAPTREIKYYPNSVDSSFTKPPSCEASPIPLMDNGFNILFAGNIGTAQSVETIVNAAILLKSNDDINFVIVGSGSRADWMKDQVTKHNLKNLHLPGRFPIEMMPAFMQKASVLLVSLIDQPIFNMTVPNKVQAYLASGKPIIASMNGEGARVVTESKAGFAVTAEDAQGLADTIIRLYKMSESERRFLGKNGRDYYNKHYDHDTLIKQLEKYFEEVIHSYGKRV